MTAPARGWPDSMDWRAKHPDELARMAEVIAATAHLLKGEPEGLTEVFMASGVPTWRHVPYALCLLAAAVEERAADFTDTMLDNPAPDTDYRDLQVTVAHAVRLWGDGDWDRLTEFALASEFGPTRWVPAACGLLASVCDSGGGHRWLMSKAEKLDELLKRGEK